MVTLEALNVGKGDKEVRFEDVMPEQRDALAEEMLGLMKKGFAIFLVQGEESNQIRGYDKVRHQWTILDDAKPLSKKKSVRKKVSAKDTTVKAVAPSAGG